MGSRSDEVEEIRAQIDETRESLGESVVMTDVADVIDERRA